VDKKVSACGGVLGGCCLLEEREDDTILSPAVVNAQLFITQSLIIAQQTESFQWPFCHPSSVEGLLKVGDNCKCHAVQVTQQQKIKTGVI